jgi:hypothetical protein
MTWYSKAALFPADYVRNPAMTTLHWPPSSSMGGTFLFRDTKYILISYFANEKQEMQNSKKSNKKYETFLMKFFIADKIVNIIFFSKIRFTPYHIENKN